MTRNIRFGALFASSAMVAMAKSDDAGSKAADNSAADGDDVTKVQETVVEPAPGLPAVQDDGNNLMLYAGQTFEIVKHVTLPTLTQEEGITVVVRINEAIRTEQKSESQKAAGEGETIQLAQVTSCHDGRLYNYVINAVTASELEDGYPNAGYVGKFFAITKLPKPKGKRYMAMNITEVTPTASAAR